MQKRRGKKCILRTLQTWKMLQKNQASHMGGYLLFGVLESCKTGKYKTEQKALYVRRHADSQKRVCMSFLERRIG